MGNQRGQAIVLIALMLTVIIGMAAIAIDGSRAYAMRRDLQAAVDAAALAAGDKLQQTGSWSSAEQAASTIFASNLRFYSAPSCGPWGAPGAAPFSVSCTYSPDNTVLTVNAQAIGPQGSLFTVSAQRNLQLQFARILTNGTTPNLGAGAKGNVGNLLYSPTIGALDRGGCGGAPGSGITVNGTGTLNLKGDLVANGSISLAAGTVRVAGDIYARCQSPVPGAVTNACYPSGAATPCSYPDIAGTTISGSILGDPGYPAPTSLGGSVGSPTGVVVQAGIYATPVFLLGSHCWFLSGGIYTFQGGTFSFGDFVSNELKPPDEPDPSNNQVRATQFWNTNGSNCAGGFRVTNLDGPVSIPLGTWGIVITSVRTDTYNGVGYTRESAPSMCHSVSLSRAFDDIELDISNVPGATSYNIYVSPPPNGCNGPFGYAANVAVSGTPSNSNTTGCPTYSGVGCSLGDESILLGAQIAPPFTPIGTASPGTTGAYAPDSETAPVAAGLPNQNPARGAGAAGDRANENNCKSLTNGYVSCPGPITPGAVMFNFPAGACMTATNAGDSYVFSGYQYDWLAVYESPSNTCANTIGSAANGAYIGLIYCPMATLNVTSQSAFNAAGVGGMIADKVSFTGPLPTITFSANYAPVPPASRITS